MGWSSERYPRKKTSRKKKPRKEGRTGQEEIRRTYKKSDV